MFQGHPKGLIVAFFSNMGERFGFYTMMAILVMFLQAKYGLAQDEAGWIYSGFYFLIYALALLGGFIADRTQNYKGTILTGIVIMFAGYVLMAIPGMGLPFAVFGLFTIALGNGLFKGNLQALVGQMYDDPAYSKLRDSAYSLFYMGINIGAVFAPNAARYIRTWYLGTQGYGYDADLPALCHQQLAGKLADAGRPPAAGRPGLGPAGDGPGRLRPELPGRVLHRLQLRLRHRRRGHAGVAGHLHSVQKPPARPAPAGGRRHRQAGHALGRGEEAAGGAGPGLPGGHLLLDVLPPERPDPDLLRPRLHRQGGRRPHLLHLRHPRPAAAGGRDHRPGVPAGQVLDVRPADRRRRHGRRRGRAGLAAVPHLRAGQPGGAGDLPAVQSVLRRLPHPGGGGLLRLAPRAGGRSRPRRARSASAWCWRPSASSSW